MKRVSEEHEESVRGPRGECRRNMMRVSEKLECQISMMKVSKENKESVKRTQ